MHIPRVSVNVSVKGLRLSCFYFFIYTEYFVCPSVTLLYTLESRGNDHVIKKVNTFSDWVRMCKLNASVCNTLSPHWTRYRPSPQKTSFRLVSSLHTGMAESEETKTKAFSFLQQWEKICAGMVPQLWLQVQPHKFHFRAHARWFPAVASSLTELFSTIQHVCTCVSHPLSKQSPPSVLMSL